MLEYMNRSMEQAAEFKEQPDDNIVICRCEEITKGEIRRAIFDGMFTMTEIRRFLRAGMGICQGRSCERITRNILEREMGGKSAGIPGFTCRGPARPTEAASYLKEIPR